MWGAVLMSSGRRARRAGHEIRQARTGHFDLVVEVPPGGDARPWEAAGATWVLTGIEPQPPENEIRQIIRAGP